MFSQHTWLGPAYKLGRRVLQAQILTTCSKVTLPDNPIWVHQPKVSKDLVMIMVDTCTPQELCPAQWYPCMARRPRPEITSDNSSICCTLYFDLILQLAHPYLLTFALQFFWCCLLHILLYHTMAGSIIMTWENEHWGETWYCIFVVFWKFNWGSGNIVGRWIR